MAIRGGFEIATAYVDLILDKDSAKRGVQELPRDLTPAADKAGRDTGNIITRGIRLSIVRNSPLIAAAIAGGLAAGAPALLAGATLIMGGVAAVAAAQSQKVQAAWVGAWDVIKRGAIEDARILEPTFVRMAGTIAAAFTEMRPAMRDAFGDLGPQLDTLTTATASFAQSFTSGLLVAIRNGGPVIDGMAKAIVSIGDGFEDAMTRMSSHSAAAGDVWAQLGDIVGSLLSILGEFLGIGVEIAHVMLPALGGSLRVILGVLETLGPLLPAIVTGFTALRIAQTAARWVDTLGASLAGVAGRTGTFATAAGKAGTVVAGFGRAIPIIAAGMAAFAATTAQNEARIKSWSQTLLRGGDSADQLRAKAASAKDSLFDLTSGDWWKRTFLLSDLWDDEAATNIVDDFNAASDAAKEYLASLTPMGRAQQEVTWAQEALQTALDKFGPGSREAAAAQGELDRASAEVTRQLAMEERQLYGVTQAMMDMATQAAARANSDIGYRQSVLDTTRAIEDLQAAQADSTTTATDLAEKTLAVEQAYMMQAEAAGKLAYDALPAVMDQQQKDALAAQASLRELDKLKEMYGGTLPANLETYRQSLINIAEGMDTSKLALDAMTAGLEDVGLKVTQLPATKQIRIEAPTQEIVDKLGELGFTITEIPGTKDVLVSADTEDAKLNLGNLAALLAGVDGTTARPTAILEDQATGPLADLMTGLLNVDGTTASPSTWLDGYEQFTTDIARLEAAVLGLDQQSAEPDATLNTTIPTQTDADLAALLGLGGTVVNPQADMQSDVGPTTATDHGLLLGLGGVVVTPQTQNQSNVTPQTQLDWSLLGALGASTHTPTTDLNDNPLRGTYQNDLSLLGILAGQRPTPTSDINTGPFAGQLGWLNNQIDYVNRQRPSPVATLIASVAGAEAALNYAARNRSSTIFANVVTNGSAQLRAQGGPVYAATGRKIVGPGGPFDDLVRAIGPGGSDYRLSAGEWIVNAMASSKYGDRAMQALNQGTATVTVPEDRQRAHGSAWQSAVRSADGGVSVTPTANGATISVGQLHVHIQGVFDLTKPMEMRRLGQRLREVLISLDRENA